MQFLHGLSGPLLYLVALSDLYSPYIACPDNRSSFSQGFATNAQGQWK